MKAVVPHYAEIHIKHESCSDRFSLALPSLFPYQRELTTATEQVAF